MRLKEFSREQTATMVLGPLEKLGVRFERPNDVVDRIFDETAGQPNLIQFYCSILVEQLGRHEVRTISPASLFDVYGNEDFRAFVLSTFMDNTTHLEKAMVFGVITDGQSERPFGVQVIDKLLEQRGLEVPLSDLDHACRNLELAGTSPRAARSTDSPRRCSRTCCGRTTTWPICSARSRRKGSERPWISAACPGIVPYVGDSAFKRARVSRGADAGRCATCGPRMVRTVGAALEREERPAGDVGEALSALLLSGPLRRSLADAVPRRGRVLYQPRLADRPGVGPRGGGSGGSPHAPAFRTIYQRASRGGGAPR